METGAYAGKEGLHVMYGTNGLIRFGHLYNQGSPATDTGRGSSSIQELTRY